MEPMCSSASEDEGGEGGEGPCLCDGDLLADGETEAENVTAAAQGEARLATAAGQVARLRGPR